MGWPVQAVKGADSKIKILSKASNAHDNIIFNPFAGQTLSVFHNCHGKCIHRRYTASHLVPWPRGIAGGSGPTGRGANMHREAESRSLRSDVRLCMLAVRGAPFYIKSGFPDSFAF